MRGVQTPLDKSQKLRLERALERLESLSSKANSDASVSVADTIPVNFEDGVLKYVYLLCISGARNFESKISVNFVAFVCDEIWNSFLLLLDFINSRLNTLTLLDLGVMGRRR